MLGDIPAEITARKHILRTYDWLFVGPFISCMWHWLRRKCKYWLLTFQTPTHGHIHRHTHAHTHFSHLTKWVFVVFACAVKNGELAKMPSCLPKKPLFCICWTLVVVFEHHVYALSMGIFLLLACVGDAFVSGKVIYRHIILCLHATHKLILPLLHTNIHTYILTYAHRFRINLYV